MLIGELLQQKGRDVEVIQGSKSVEDAILQMTERNVSALIVMERDRCVGIFAERDVIRCYVQRQGTPFQKVRISDAMTSKLISAQPDDAVLSTVHTMFQADIRHLPIFEEGKLVGLLSLKDLAQYELGALESEIQFLKEYISDLREAGQD
jgi:CBS domain-containing protein